VTIYSVEVTLPPVKDGDWSGLRRMTDVVPGTILLEDPEQPALIFPVEADDPRSAAIFVEGVASIASLNIVAGCVAELEDADFDEPEDGSESSLSTTEAGFKPGWMNGYACV
jgi:hypothetical protein